jgi:hypothetical protein
MRKSFFGKRPLWQAFWIISIGGYLIASIVDFFIFALSIDYFKAKNLYLLLFVTSPIMILYFALSLPSVYRCGKSSKFSWRLLTLGFLLFLLICNLRGVYRIWTYYIPSINMIGENGF